MAPIRKYLKIGQNQTVALQIYLDSELLQTLAQKVRTTNATSHDDGPDDDTDSIQQLNPFTLPVKDVDELIAVLGPHIVRVLSASENNSYSCAEFYNLRSMSFKGKRRVKEEAGVMQYRLNEKGWKASVKVERPEWSWGGFNPSVYSDEQVLERRIEIEEKVEEGDNHNDASEGDGEEEEEKPLVLKKKVETKYKRLLVMDDQKVVVYLQEKPKRAKPVSQRS